MDFAPVPATAAWQHRDARAGFEVVYFQPSGEGGRIEGWTTAIEDGSTWAVEYIIDLGGTGATRSARIRGRSAAGFSLTLLEADEAGRWLVDGVPAPHLGGCLDVDLESSAMTNALPVRRMGLAPGARAAAPAAYVRAIGLAADAAPARAASARRCDRIPDNGSDLRGSRSWQTPQHLIRRRPRPRSRTSCTRR